MFSGVKDAVSNARDAVSDVASAASDVGSAGKDLAKEGAGTVFDGDIFEMDTLKTVLGGTAEVLTGKRTAGSTLGGVLDRVGLPDWATDFAQAAVDGMMGRVDSSIPAVLSATSGVSEKAGLDGLSDFLGTASDVTGVAGDIGRTALLTYATGGLGKAGIAAEVGRAGQLGKAGTLVAQASDLADSAETAVDVVQGHRDGDLAAVGSGMLDMMGVELYGLDEVLGDQIDPEVLEAIQHSLGGTNGVLTQVLGQMPQFHMLDDAAMNQILDDLDTSPDDAAVTAEEVVDFALQIGRQAEAGTGLGTHILDSDEGQAFVDALADAAPGGGSGEFDGDALVREVARTTRGLLDMADMDPDVATDVAQTLAQAGAMTNTSAVGELIGAQMRV